MAGQKSRNHTVVHAKSMLKQPGRSLGKGGAKDARLGKSKYKINSPGVVVSGLQVTARHLEGRLLAYVRGLQLACLCVYSLFNRMIHADTDPQG